MAGGPRKLYALAAAAVALASCTTSKVDPDARIDISGSLRRQDGTPAGGVRLALNKEPDVLEALGTVMSLGLACLDQNIPDTCGDARTSGTDTEGRFAFRLEGRDTQGSVGNASTLELSALLPRTEPQLAGPGVTLRFLVQTERLRLPLGFWEPAVRATADARTIRIRWSGVRDATMPADASIAELRYAVRFATGSDEVWEFARAQSDRPLDARVLEDTRGSFAVVARADGIPTTEETGSKIDVILRSARYPYAGTAGAPSSRGAACSTVRGTRAFPQASCRLTDGDFSDPLGTTAPCRQGRPCKPVRHAVVDLARATTVTTVVVRGCSLDCSVATSRNGRRWAPQGRLDAGVDDDVLFELGSPVRARYVRVSSRSDIDDLREVSVWGPGPAGTSRSLIQEAEGEGTLEVLPAGSPAWVWIVLAAVAGLVIGAVVTLVVRRRKPAA